MSNDLLPEDNSVNPYAPTTSTTRDPFVGPEELADRGTRLLAAIVDGFLMMACIIPIQFLSGFTERAMAQEVGALETLAMSLVGVLVFLALFGYLLATRGQTVGKMLLKIRIVDAETSELLPFMRVYVYRYLWSVPLVVITALIPSMVDDMLFNLIYLVDILMIFRADRRCLHDLIAGSKVVKIQRT